MAGRIAAKEPMVRGKAVLAGVGLLAVALAVVLTTWRLSGNQRSTFDSPPVVAAGLTSDGELVGFASNDPGKFAVIGRISGLRGDRRLVGIECRATTGTVYGVGDRGGVYTLNLQTAAA